MLSQMVNINRACRTAHLLIKTQRGLAQADKTGRSHLNNRIRGYLSNHQTSVKELVQIYHYLAIESSQSSLFGLTEEKLLGLLTVPPTDDVDDMVDRYLPKKLHYDYSSLCRLFIEIASVGRRPTPLMKAASNCLTEIPLPNRKPEISTLISTLDALVKLNYTYQPLVNRIISDITNMINLNDIDVLTQCSLLRSLGGLKWRHEPLMELFYNHVNANHDDIKMVTPNLLLTLFYVTANLNYRPPIDIKEFYQSHMAGTREDFLDKKSRKWLNYVWSLAVLNVAEESHLRSVLNDEFIEGIENPLGLQRFVNADMMKLLNLRAILRLEMRLDNSSRLLDELAQQRIQRSSGLQKFGTRMKVALNSLVKTDKELRHDIHTPYGFVTDCEALLSKEMDFIKLDDKTTLEDELSLAETWPRICDMEERKCAIIYILFEEAISNHQDEPVGHKKIISRILRNAGYRTVFLQECLLNKEKTSYDLAVKIKETITKALKDDPIEESE